ncbi:unnamed protein product [Symbiodinium sp. CCMP2456]|nr:unnamed protein product [Symbiodinium sp. CCMP2456]
MTAVSKLLDAGAWCHAGLACFVARVQVVQASSEAVVDNQDLLITKYKEKLPGLQRKPKAKEVSANLPLPQEARNSDVLSVTEANVAQMDVDHETVPVVEEDAMSSYSTQRAASRLTNALQAYLSAPVDPPALASIGEQHEGLDKTVWLKQKLRHDLDRQMADEKLKQERAKAEEQRYLQIQVEATQKDRDGQLALIRSQRDEDRLKARRDQVHKDFAETAEASKAKADELAVHEQQQVEAYEKLRAHREEKRREAAEKEAAQRKEIEKNAGLRAMAMQKMADDTELKAAAERAAKELAAERQEQATRKRLEDMKNQTQEYLLQQMKEKQLKKATEAEKARQLASAQAAEAKQLEAQEQERMARKKKMIHDHRKDLERQIAADTSDIGPQPQQCMLLTAEETMSDCELRLNKQLLEKVTLVSALVYLLCAWSPRFFGAMNLGESTSDEAFSHTDAGDDLGLVGYTETGSASAESQVFAETPSAGSKEAWQTFWPGSASVPTNRIGPKPSWVYSNTEFMQPYTTSGEGVPRQGLKAARWFDNSVLQYNGMGQPQLPPFGVGARLVESSAASTSWVQRAVNTSLLCKEAGCTATSKLQVFDPRQEEAQLCRLTIEVHPTDYDNLWSKEFVRIWKINEHLATARCDPHALGCNASAWRPLVPCLQDLNVDHLLAETGSLLIEGSINKMVDECPYHGYLLNGVAVVTCMARKKVAEKALAAPHASFGGAPSDARLTARDLSNGELKRSLVAAGGAGALQAAGLNGVGQDAGLNGVRFAHLDGTAADDANGLLGAAGGAAVLGSDGAGNGSSGTGSLSDETRALLGDRAAELDDAALAAAGLNAEEIAELRAKARANFLADALAPGAVLSNTTSMQCCEPGCAVMSEIHVDPIFLRAGATCLMNFTVVQTDFDEAVGNDVERIEFIHVEGLGNISEGVKPGRNCNENCCPCFPELPSVAPVTALLQDPSGTAQGKPYPWKTEHEPQQKGVIVQSSFGSIQMALPNFVHFVLKAVICFLGRLSSEARRYHKVSLAEQGEGLHLLEQVERRDSQLQGVQALYEQYSECRRSLQAADANKRVPGTGYLVPKDVAEAKELHNAAEKLLRHKESQIQELQRHNKELLDELQRKELAHTHTCREATRLSQENGHLKATLGRLVAQQKRELQGELQEKELAHLETCREATRLAQENGHLKSELSRLQQRLRQQTDIEGSSEAPACHNATVDSGRPRATEMLAKDAVCPIEAEVEVIKVHLHPQDVSRLQALATKLAQWLLAEEGFGRSLDDFFRAHSQYFDDYQEEHALHYTTLHKEFSAKLEAEVEGWLAEEGLTTDDLAVILKAAKESVTGEDPAAEVDLVEMMLEAVDYQKWIGSIFAIKRRIRERRKVRARKAPPPPPPPSESKVVDVVVPEGVAPGESLRISVDGVGYDVVVPESFEPGMFVDAEGFVRLVTAGQSTSGPNSRIG